MVLKVASFKIRTKKNKLNRFWNPIGRFWNPTEILLNNEWYRYGLIFSKVDERYFVKIDHPMKVDESTSRITEILYDGVYAEVEISSIKVHLLKYLQNNHRINHFSYKFRKGLFERKRTFLVFSFALIPSILFYLTNAYQNSVIIHMIAENI